MRTAAILPVKQFTRAKQRLGESVDDDLRGRLARAMVEDVLSALADQAPGRAPGPVVRLISTSVPLPRMRSTTSR